MSMDKRSIIRALECQHIDGRYYTRRDVIAAARDGGLGELAFAALDREDEALHGLPGWPVCECTCECDEPATTTDDGGAPVCAACENYTVDDAGEVHCSRCDDTEWVQDGVHGYLRVSPPEPPTPDPSGHYALYWYSSSTEDEHVVARFATAEAAEQAVAAADWPGPTDHTHYLCGYEVREYVAGEWVIVEEEDA